MASAGLGQPQRAASAGGAVVEFDLPAQPLATAIESYSVASGWQVIYDSSLAEGRRSTAVKGAFAPAAALRQLLTGSGLAPDYLAADGAMLVPDPSAASSPGLARHDPAPAIRDYDGRIQVGLERAFCADARLANGAYRMAIGLWIGASGAVTRAEPLGSTGQSEIDAAFDRAAGGVVIGQPPPPGFDQPVVVLVTPDLLAQCRSPGARATRAAR